MTEPELTHQAQSDRRDAIALMLDAFDAGRAAGIAEAQLSRAALFQSIMHIVDELGEEAAAHFLRTSAKGVQSGYYSRATSVN